MLSILLFVAGKKKKLALKAAAMDADDGAGWTTGPFGDAGEGMDTREAGAGAGPDAPAGPAPGEATPFGCVQCSAVTRFHARLLTPN